MGWRGWLEREGHTEIKVVALWSKDMNNVYEAKRVVLHLRYKTTGLFVDESLDIMRMNTSFTVVCVMNIESWLYFEAGISL